MNSLLTDSDVTLVLLHVIQSEKELGSKKCWAELQRCINNITADIAPVLAL